MKLLLSILFSLLFFSNTESKKYGEYIFWEKIKYELEGHPNLKIIDFETGLSWMVTVCNKNVKKSFHADVEPSSMLDQKKSTQLPSTKVGLKNIEKRYALISDRSVEIVNDGYQFSVSLPLLKDSTIKE